MTIVATISTKNGVLLAAGVILAGLGGCKKNTVEMKDATPAQVASAVATSDARPKPGRWEATVRMEAMDLPGMPPEARAMMKNASAEHHVATCLSKEDAEKNPDKMFDSGQAGCKYDHFSMAGGTVDGTMTCKRAGETMTVSMKGTYDPEHFAVKTETKGTMPGGQAMTSKMTMESAWKGECKGNEVNAANHGAAKG